MLALGSVIIQLDVLALGSVIIQLDVLALDSVIIQLDVPRRPQMLCIDAEWRLINAVLLLRQLS